MVDDADRVVQVGEPVDLRKASTGVTQERFEAVAGALRLAPKAR
jgi:hypothetical protein